MTTNNSTNNVFRGTLKEFCARFGMEYTFALPLVKLLESKGVAKCVDKILVLGCARRVAVYELPVEFTLNLADAPEDEELGELPATENSAPATGEPTPETKEEPTKLPALVPEPETEDVFANAS